MRPVPYFLRRVSGLISARTRIVMGQVFVLAAVLLVAIAMGLVPDARAAAAAARVRLCEAIAIHCSATVARGDVSRLKNTLGAMIQRDSEILRLVVRRSDGKIVARLEPQKLSTMPDSTATVHVSIYTSNRKWGELEIDFQPLYGHGLLAYVQSPQVSLVLFVTGLCAAGYLFYLRKVLQNLDPSKAVPPRVRSALDTLAEGLLVLDDSKRIVLANHAFARIVGKSPDEMMGVPVGRLNWESVDGDGQVPQPWNQVIAGDAPQRDVIIRLRDHEDKRRTFSVNCSPVLGNEGKSRGVLVSLDDITVLEQKEVELRNSKDAAESANRAKSDFLARMSHEIRTPMNAILGFADVLRRGFDTGAAERQEYLETIHASGQHLLELINDILDLSKIEAGKLEVEPSRVSPHKLISEVISVLSVRASQKGIQLEFCWQGAAPESISTDPTRFRQALTNLVGNAIKFTEVGSVRVVAQLSESEDLPRLKVDVVDTGVGMKPEAMARIFQPFAQGDSSITRRFGGTGLGLSISQQIARALGGDITVQSEEGKGSVFTFSIQTGPLEGVRLLDSTELRAAAAERPAAAELKLPPVKVLVVEDGASNRRFIQLVLGRAGATTVMAEDGKAGADLALADEYDVILMDMQMPVMDGYSATRLLRQKGLTTPIIALTAHAMRGDEEKCRDAGCTGFVTKPIDMDVLVRAIRDSLPAQRQGEASQPVPAPTQRAESSQTHPHDDATGGEPVLRSTLPTEDPEFCQIVEEFVERLHNQLGAIQGAWARQDLEELASLAHWVKGSGGTAGFAALTDPARQLELAARQRQLSDIAGAISQLQDLTSRIKVSAPPSAQTPDEPMNNNEDARVVAAAR